MHLGKFIESEEIFERPLHPYSRALLSYPDSSQKPPRFVMRGEIPSTIDLPSGCHLRPRCFCAIAACQESCPPLENPLRGRAATGFRVSEMA